MYVFQPTLPLRGATRCLGALQCASRCFNPRSPCGERLNDLKIKGAALKFQPTLPLRGATFRGLEIPLLRPVSTHAPLAGSDSVLAGFSGHGAVSTHAPLAGSDKFA